MFKYNITDAQNVNNDTENAISSSFEMFATTNRYPSKLLYLKYGNIKNYALFLDSKYMEDVYSNLTSFESNDLIPYFEDKDVFLRFINFNSFMIIYDTDMCVEEYDYLFKMFALFFENFDQNEYCEELFLKAENDYLVADNEYNFLKKRTKDYLESRIDYITFVQYVYFYYKVAISFSEKFQFENAEDYVNGFRESLKYQQPFYPLLKIILVKKKLSMADQCAFLNKFYLCCGKKEESCSINSNINLLANYEPVRGALYFTNNLIFNIFLENDMNEEQFINDSINSFVNTNRSHEIKDFYRSNVKIPFEYFLGSYLCIYSNKKTEFKIASFVNHFLYYYEVYKFVMRLSRDDNAFLKSIKNGDYTTINLKKQIDKYYDYKLTISELSHVVKLFCYETLLDRIEYQKKLSKKH